MSNRSFEGLVPKNPVYACVGSIDHDGSWDVYFSNFDFENKTWVNFKLVFNGKRKSKANFWLSYNYDEHRFANNSCYRVLIQTYADLIPKIISFIGENKNCFSGVE